MLWETLSHSRAAKPDCDAGGASHNQRGPPVFLQGIIQMAAAFIASLIITANNGY
jgi:hypothetical protein